MSKKIVTKAATAKVASLSATAIKMREMIEASASHDLAVIGLRNQLKVLAQQVFKAPLSVAAAADKLGLNISVKDLEKDALTERATVQRIRVTLERALKDSDRYLKVEGKGRKPRQQNSVEGENEGEGEESGAGVVATLKAAASTRDAVNAILTALDGLSRAQLVRVQGKLATLLAQAAKEGEAKPAKGKKAKAA